MHRSDAEQRAHILSLLLRAAGEPTAWQELLQELTLLTGSSSGYLFHAASHTVANFQMPAGFADEYQRDLAPLDVVGRYAVQQQDFCGTTSRLFEQQPQLRVPEYEQRLSELGMQERWGATLPGGATIGLHRGSEQAPYNDKELQLLNSLLPQLRQASQLSAQTAQAGHKHAGLLNCLDQLQHGVILLDSEGAPLLANQWAARLAPAHGLPLPGYVKQPSISIAPNLEVHILLEKVLSGQRQQAAIRLPHPEKGIELQIQWLPLPESGLGQVALILTPAMVEIALDPSLAHDLYDLTRAEVEVLELLCNGHGGKSIAVTRGTAEQTARSQIKTIREKTTTSSQIDLVRLGLRAPRLRD